MVKEELGRKRTCPACAVRFYDLLKEPAVCPRCGDTFVVEDILPSKTSAPVDDKPKAETGAPAEKAKTMDEVPPDDDGDDDEDDEAAVIEGVVLDGDDDEAAASGDDKDVFLEDDDDESSSVADLIGGGGQSDDET